MQEKCIFCKIIEGKLPAEKIYEDESSLAFLDINPVNPGHCLVVSKEHFDNLLATPPSAAKRLTETVLKVSQAVREAVAAEGINININNGRAAGQVVFHTHIHIIPRYKGDGLKLWSGAAYRDANEMSALAEKIRQAIK